MPQLPRRKKLAYGGLFVVSFALATRKLLVLSGFATNRIEDAHQTSKVNTTAPYPHLPTTIEEYVVENYGVLDNSIPADLITGKFCLLWEYDSDDWWSHRADWEVTDENATHYCFAPMEDKKKAKFLRELYDIQFHSDCRNVTTRQMWSSGWGADITNVVDGLLLALETKQPTQMWHHVGWHMAAMKDGSRPVCSTKDMYCYFLSMTRCKPKRHEVVNWRSTTEQKGKKVQWLREYATRPQTWFRHEIYKYSTTAINLTAPCTVLHVRRADIVLHDDVARRYHPIEEYMNTSVVPERNIFLLTDDQNAIGEALYKFPNHEWVTFDRPRHKGAEGGWESQIPSGDPKLETTILMSIFRLVPKCNSFIHATGSLSKYITGVMKAKRGKNLTIVDIDGVNGGPRYSWNNSLTVNVSQEYPAVRLHRNR